MAAKLSTHVLDTAHGSPASGMELQLWSITGESRTLIATTTTNADGRTDAPLLAGEDLKRGQYEIVFFVGDYFRARGSTGGGISFLETVPVRFGIADPDAGYHVPLLCSPWAYSTYRGS